MPKIGIVTTWFDRGAAYVSKAFKESLEASGHEVFIYARGGERTEQGNPRWDGPKVHWAKRLPVTQIDVNEFDSWFQKNQLQAVLFNEQQDWDIVHHCHNKGIPIIAYVDYYKKQTVEQFVLYDALICNTQRHYSVFKNHANAHYIPWGTDVDLFHPQPKPEHLKGKFVFFHNGGMLGVNGRKGTAETVRAFVNFNNPSAHLVIHSQVPLGIQHPQITVISETRPQPGFYHWGDVYVYPSKLEGIGLSIAEAMASGLPVITTNEPPMSEFVQDGVNGRLVKVAQRVPRGDGYYWPEAYVDVNDLSQVMAFYLANPRVRDLHAQKSRELAVANFNWKKNDAAMDAVIKSVVK